MSFTSSTPCKTKPGIDDSGLNLDMCDLSQSNSQDSDLLNSKETHIISIEKVFDNDDLDDCQDTNSGMSVLDVIQGVCGKNLKKIVIALFCTIYTAFFIAALVIAGLHTCDEEHDIVPLIVLTVFTLFVVVAFYIRKWFGDSFQELCAPCSGVIHKHWHILRWILTIVPFIGIVVIIIVSATQRLSNLMSLVGWFFLVGLLFLCSKAPTKVNWRPVLGGFALQFYFATIILKSDWGYDLFDFLGKVFRNFLSFSDYGASFVFGKLDDHIFAFKVLPVIIFFSCVITMLYYLGAMQVVIRKIAFVMKVTLGTTFSESLCAAGNIFVGQTEAPIMIRPFLNFMTRSELHAVMVGGFGTIAGAVLAAYIMKGVPAIHLLTACVMNAPTALAVSKLLYPELNKSRSVKMNQVIEEKMPYNNVIEAAAAGASSAISLVANVAANLIAFVALLYFADSVLSWFGSFICYPELSFQLLCHYALMPLTYIMGVDWEDAGQVAELIGIKTFLNEFFAYDQLSNMITNREKCLDGPMISARSETIATYALCGFANLSSIGIQLGGLGSMAPKRMGDLAQLAVSALFGGIVTNLLTACIAGLLVIDDPSAVNATSACMNATTTVGYALVNSTAL